MTRSRLYVRALRALWRVGLLRIWPWMALRIWLAWLRCRGSLAFLAEVAAIRAGSRVALIDDDGPLTFAELRARYEALAGDLIARLSAGPGRQIAIIGRNHRSVIVALLAAARTGADALLLNPDSPPSVLAKLLAACPPPGRTGANGGAKQNGEASPTIILHAAGLDVAALAPGAPRLALPLDLEYGSATAPLPRLTQPGRLCVLTAGSTGLPKRIGRKPTIASLLPILLGLLEAMPITMHRPTVLAVPLFHGHGLATLAAALAFASPVHLARRYAIAPLLERSPIASPPVVVSVPTLLARWVAAGPVRGRVAAVLTGSAPLEPQLCRRLLEVLGPVVYNLYGSTEAGVVALATPSMLAEAPGTVGRPLPGTEVRVLDAAGRETAAGQSGRIQVRGPLVLRGDAEGWLDTGDLGRFDEAGRLHICGRTDGMFISGGENVYPQEVESCLIEHPCVTEAAIAVVADAEFGARMRAFVVVRPGAPLTREALCTWLRERLDRHQQPRSIELLDALPRNLLGKIDRPALQVLAERTAPGAALPEV
jgi:fatty-acyl-CoA synthase